MMIEALRELVNNKRIAVLGYGREGRSTLKRVMQVGGYASLTVVDIKDFSAELPVGVDSVSGDKYLDDLDRYDIVFKTPGVVLPKAVEEYGCEFTSQCEVFISAYRDQVVGVTGTKGKSTTSSLIYHVLSTAGADCLFAGNIGIPVFDIADDVKENTIVVLELSCHQLEYINVSPHRAILLNIYEDHLDHYGTREKYGKAKVNIYKYQELNDILLSTKETLDEWGYGNSKVELITADCLPFKNFSELEGVELRGNHNLLNCAFVYTLVAELGVDDETFIKAVSTFKPLAHRLEFIGKVSGVDYYDDSISTTVRSTISAIDSIENARLILLGGMERNIEYTDLVEYLTGSKLKYLLCMYESGKRLMDMYEALNPGEDSPKAVWCENLEKAVAEAKKRALPGEAVLLSPAAASYGYFKNFEERGDCFKNLVKNAK